MTNTGEALGEFEAIAEFFAPLAGNGAPAFELTDDAAVYTPPPGQALVLTKDAMVEGVHFLPTDPPDLVARKLLRVNLSDLAAMGAEAVGYLQATAVRPADAASWLKAFARGLAEDQAIFGCRLWGGDTTSTPGPITLSLTAIGLTPPGAALRRNGARLGDLIAVTGTIGDSALGLLARRGELEGLGAAALAYLKGRYLLPEPRLAVGKCLRGVAHAALDVSDGLVADMAHICQTSGVGAQIRLADIPLSPAARAAITHDPRRLADIFKGDDYELLFTIPPAKAAELHAIAPKTGVPITLIGEVVEGSAVRLFNADGSAFDAAGLGFTHF